MAKKSNPRKTIQPKPLVVRADYKSKSGMHRKSARTTPAERRNYRRLFSLAKSDLQFFLKEQALQRKHEQAFPSQRRGFWNPQYNSWTPWPCSWPY